MDPEKYPHPNLMRLSMLFFFWQKRIKVADDIKIAKWLSL